MREEEDVERLLNAIKKAFPDDAVKANEVMEGLGYGETDCLGSLWLEVFADVTNAAMKRKDESVSKSHLEFISRELDKGDETLENAIDVGYVENLMFRFNDAGKKWVWERFPGNIKALYQRTWGEPRL